MKHSALLSSRLWCVWTCLSTSGHAPYLTSCTSHISRVVMDISSDIAGQSLRRCNNSDVVGQACWLLQVLSHTQTHSKCSSSRQVNSRGQPWNAEVFTLNGENEIPSQSLMFGETFR